LLLWILRLLDAVAVEMFKKLAQLLFSPEAFANFSPEGLLQPWGHGGNKQPERVGQLVVPWSPAPSV
jgi:hypothetical protein